MLLTQPPRKRRPRVLVAVRLPPRWCRVRRRRRLLPRWGTRPRTRRAQGPSRRASARRCQVSLLTERNIVSIQVWSEWGGEIGQGFFRDLSPTSRGSPCHGEKSQSKCLFRCCRSDGKHRTARPRSRRRTRERPWAGARRSQTRQSRRRRGAAARDAHSHSYQR